MKLCYICREEEFHDSTFHSSSHKVSILEHCYAEPQSPPVTWVHPCNCTLVAHESCLLSWIQSAQQDSARATNALKCPQCAAVYEIESDKPLVLRVLNNLNSSLSVVGRLVSGAGLICIVGSLGFGEHFSPFFHPPLLSPTSAMGQITSRGSTSRKTNYRLIFRN